MNVISLWDIYGNFCNRDGHCLDRMVCTLIYI